MNARNKVKSVLLSTVSTDSSHSSTSTVLNWSSVTHCAVYNAVTVLSECTFLQKEVVARTGFHFSIPRQKIRSALITDVATRAGTPHENSENLQYVACLVSFLCPQIVVVELMVLKLHRIDVTGYPKQFFLSHSQQILR